MQNACEIWTIHVKNECEEKNYRIFKLFPSSKFWEFKKNLRLHYVHLLRLLLIKEFKNRKFWYRCSESWDSRLEKFEMRI